MTFLCWGEQQFSLKLTECDLNYLVSTKFAYYVIVTCNCRLPNGGPGLTGWEGNDPRDKRMKQEITELADVMQNLRPCK